MRRKSYPGIEPLRRRVKALEREVEQLKAAITALDGVVALLKDVVDGEDMNDDDDGGKEAVG
jgi:hypothetical protein